MAEFREKSSLYEQLLHFQKVGRNYLLNFGLRTHFNTVSREFVRSFRARIVICPQNTSKLSFVICPAACELLQKTQVNLPYS